MRSLLEADSQLPFSPDTHCWPCFWQKHVRSRTVWLISCYSGCAMVGSSGSASSELLRRFPCFISGYETRLGSENCKEHFDELAAHQEQDLRRWLWASFYNTSQGQFLVFPQTSQFQSLDHSSLELEDIRGATEKQAKSALFVVVTDST